MAITTHLSIDPATAQARLQGDWTLPEYERLRRSLPDIDTEVQALDASNLQALDTAGASLLAELLGAERLQALLPGASGLSEERRALLLTVAAALHRQSEGASPQSPRWTDGLAQLGETVLLGWQGLLTFLGFAGLTLSVSLSLLFRPQRWRLTALVAQMHQTGFNAVPIVALLNFLVGAVVAFLGATVLSQFGATIYTVDLVAYAFMRELGVLLAAIMLAGRTASAFAAQLGSMKLNEELDALRVQGLSMVELLVLPRLLALILMLPLLSFFAVMAGMVGGAVVATLALDISSARFIEIVQEVPLHHLLLGLSKAPVFAVVIGLIGCLEGLKVESSAESLGEHTTSAVVQSIFAVIMLDAVAALFFMGMGW